MDIIGQEMYQSTIPSQNFQLLVGGRGVTSLKPSFTQQNFSDDVTRKVTSSSYATTLDPSNQEQKEMDRESSPPAAEQEPNDTCCGGLYVNNPVGGGPRIFFEWIALPTVLFFGVAFGIYSGDKATYDENIAASFPTSSDGICVSLSMFLYVTTMLWVNVYPLRYKGLALGWNMKDSIFANQYFYKTAHNLRYQPELPKNNLKVVDLEAGVNTLVILEHDGLVGKYNRANRSMNHMAEQSFSIFVVAYALGKIFPIPTLVISILWSIGRVGHQKMYSEKGYGMSTHLPFYVMESYSRMTLHGLLLVVALRCGGAL
jgi:hypothetical protein